MSGKRAAVRRIMVAVLEGVADLRRCCDAELRPVAGECYPDIRVRGRSASGIDAGSRGHPPRFTVAPSAPSSPDGGAARGVWRGQTAE